MRTTPIASLVCSAISLAIFIYAAVLLKTYSPVYKPVECFNTNKTFSFITNSSGAFVSASVIMDCTNNNHYSVEMTRGDPGRVFMYPDMIDLGTVETEPYALEAGGSAEMKAGISLAIPMASLPLLLSGPKSILEEMHVNALAHLHFFGIRFDFNFKETNTCGFNMQVVVPDYLTGPAICATSQERLLNIIPNITASPTPFEIGLDEERLERFERIRDAALGSLMALSLLIVLVAIAFPVYDLRRRSMKTPQKDDIEAKAPAAVGEGTEVAIDSDLAQNEAV